MRKIMLSAAMFLAAALPYTAFAGWANLSPAQEVPPVTNAPNAGGTAIVMLDEAAGKITYEIVVNGLSANITGSHFHGAAEPGVNAGVVKGFTITDNHAKGEWTRTDANQPLTDEHIQMFKDGLLYLNVHTSTNPGGEIRGQVHPEDAIVAVMNAAQEVPAPTGVPENAIGVGVVSLNEDQTQAQLSVTVANMSGPLTAGHIHGPALPGSPAGVVKGLTFNGFHAEGTWSSSDANQPMTSNLLGQLRGGHLYYNVHTAANGPGEIRGQLMRQRSQTSSMKVWEHQK